MKSQIEPKLTTFANGLPVYVREFVRDGGTLVYLDMFGTHTALKATWAAFKGGGKSSHFDGLNFKLKAKEHEVIKSTLPNGMRNWIVIHKHAIPTKVQPHENAYLVHTRNSFVRDWGQVRFEEYDCPVCDYTAYICECVPDNFLPILNALLPMPILNEWADLLWYVGEQRGLVEQLEKRSSTGPASRHSFTIHADIENWGDVIKQQLQAKTITLPLN